MEPTEKTVFHFSPGSLILASPALPSAVVKPCFASCNLLSSKLAFSSLILLQHCLPTLLPTGRMEDLPTQKLPHHSDAAFGTHHGHLGTVHNTALSPHLKMELILLITKQDGGWQLLLAFSVGSHTHIQDHSWISNTGAESRAMASWYGLRKDKGNPIIYFSAALQQHSSSWLLRGWKKLTLQCWTYCSSAHCMCRFTSLSSHSR